MVRMILSTIKKFIPTSFKMRMLAFTIFVNCLLVLRRIRNSVLRKRPIRVIFLVSDVAKWKCQSLYDLMKDDTMYEPIIGIMRRDVETKLEADIEAITNGIKKTEEYFVAHGCRILCVFDLSRSEYVDLRKYSPDIVFYQQPWNISSSTIGPYEVSKYSLTCYVPYFVPNYFNNELTYGLGLHKLIWRYFVLNNEEALRWQSMRRFFNYAGRCVAVGHPMLDDFYMTPIEDPKKPCVIYAPHFTFSHPNNPVIVHYSTFLSNGKWLLQYAKGHPEMNWVFKPHPVLKTALRKSKVWSDDQIEAYYSEWGKIGRVCEDGDYMPLFREATAMITDCGSFLSEFGSTKKPIIHLINPENKLDMPELYATYYKVHNLDELSETLHEVLEKGNDYKKDIRIKAVEKANLSGQYAAKNIMEFFDKEFKITR